MCRKSRLIRKQKKEKKRKEWKKEEKRDFSTKAIDLKEKKKKKKERDRGLDRDTKRNGEDVETLLWASFGDRGSEVEQGNRESYDCHGINKCGEVAALHGWTSEPETLPSYRFLLSFVSLASCLSRHRAEGSWLHNFALLLLDLAFFHSSIGPAFHSPSPPFFFSMHNLSLSLSLFSSFLLALALEGNRCTPSLSFYLYARCGQIILESYYILVARSSPPSTFSPGSFPLWKKCRGGISFTYISTCVMNWLREYEPLLLGDLYLFAVLDSARNFYHPETCRYNFLFSPSPRESSSDSFLPRILQISRLKYIMEIRRLKLSLMRDREN